MWFGVSNFFLDNDDIISLLKCVQCNRTKNNYKQCALSMVRILHNNSYLTEVNFVYPSLVSPSRRLINIIVRSLFYSRSVVPGSSMLLQ